MSPEDLSYWLTILVSAAATAGGVFLAFALERSIERRRDDDAAFWSARLWAHSMARRRVDGLGKTLVRFMVYGRTSPKRPEVQAALRRVDPQVEQWWSKATECLVEAEDPFLPGSAVGERAREWADRIDVEFARCMRRWPSRRARLRRLTSSLDDPPVLTTFVRPPLPF